MNIYEMSQWIRDNDNSENRRWTSVVDFLQMQHLTGRISSEDVFYMYKDIMVGILQTASFEGY